MTIKLFIFVIIFVHKSLSTRYNWKNCGLDENKYNKDFCEDKNIYEKDPHNECGCRQKFIHKIPYSSTPYSSSSLYLSQNVVDVQLTSVCIRCGLCLAIAKEINQTLIDVHGIIFPVTRLPEIEVAHLLKSICDNSFQHYSLREVEGERLISDRMPGAILVPTSADGQWGKILRDKCNELLDEIGSEELYEYWQRWDLGKIGQEDAPDLATVLCKNDFGIFRDCRNMEN